MPKHTLLPQSAIVDLRDGDEYRVLSVRQPWAWAIIHAGKDVENRPRVSHHRGPLLIHASKAKAREDDRECLAQMLQEIHGSKLKLPDRFATGELIGLVDLVDCTDDSKSPWADRGAFHLTLAKPRAVAPGIQLNGQLGIWKWTVGTVNKGWLRKSAGP